MQFPSLNILVGVFGLVASLTVGATAASAGSIVLTGHDPDFHALSVSPENPLGAQHINQRAIAYITDPAANPFAAGGLNKFLVVESAPAVVPSIHRIGSLGLAASGFALGTDFDVATAATLNAALDQLGSGYNALVVTSDYGGVLAQAELDILNARSGDIIDFLNNGGGLYAMAESNNGAHLTPSGGHFGFLPFVVLSTSFNQTEEGIVLTPFGQSLGLTAEDVNHNFSHNFFEDDFGLNVVDLDRFGNILTLAGRGQIDPNTGIIPEPGSVSLLGLGLIVGALRRRRRG